MAGIKAQSELRERDRLPESTLHLEANTMDTIDYATKLCKEFDVDQSDAIKMLDMETDDRRNDLFHIGPKLRYQQDLDAAYEGIRSWLTEGDEYRVKLEWEDLAKFVVSHRRACVWAVLTCKARKVKA